MYENLTQYERALARFGDKCALIAGVIRHWNDNPNIYIQIDTKETGIGL